MKSISLSPHCSFSGLARGPDGLDDELLGQVHHGAVVAVGLIEFQHREFRVVPGVDAFVAIDAAQFIHPLDAADHQPLEVQLQGDAEEEVDVQGIVVRGERPRGRAAGDGVQRRAFDLDEAFARQRVADRLHDLRPPQETLPLAVGMDQVEIAHPLPQLGVGQALVLFRRGFDALGEEVDVGGEDGQLAHLGAAQLAVDADQVAQVELLGQFPVLLAHLLHADRHLDASGPVVQVEEDQLAGPAQEHDPPRRPDLRPVQFWRLARLGGRLGDDLVLAGTDFADGRMVVEAVPPGVDAHFLYFAQLHASCGFEGGGAVLWFVGFWVAHGSG